MPPISSSAEGSRPFTRRAFLERTCRAVLAAGLAGGAAHLAGCDTMGGADMPEGVSLVGNTLTIDTDRTPDLARADGFLWVPRADAIVIHDDEVGYRAFSSICPHKGKQVESFDGNRLRCPAHGWTFDVDGSGSSGADLDRFPLTQNGSLLTIDVS